MTPDEASIKHRDWLISEKSWFKPNEVQAWFDKPLNELRDNRIILGAWMDTEKDFWYPAFQFKEKQLHLNFSEFLTELYKFKHFDNIKKDKGGWHKIFYLCQPYVFLSEKYKVTKEYYDANSNFENFFADENIQHTINKASDKCFSFDEWFPVYPEFCVTELKRMVYEDQHPEFFW